MRPDMNNLWHSAIQDKEMSMRRVNSHSLWILKTKFLGIKFGNGIRIQVAIRPRLYFNQCFGI